MLCKGQKAADCRKWGGSAADSEHIARELMKQLLILRPVPAEYEERLIAADQVIGTELAENLEQGLMAVPLTAHEALATAYID